MTLNEEHGHIDIFTKIYNTKLWGDNKNEFYNGSSGSGSCLKNNVEYNDFVTSFIKNNGIKKVVDLGCGDWQSTEYIYKEVDVEYHGYDAFKDLIIHHEQKYPQYNFHHVDILNNFDVIEQADLCILKDVIQHWTCKEIEHFMKKNSNKFKFILICNCKNQLYDWQDVDSTRWRPLNANKFPLKKYNPKIELEFFTKQISVIYN